MALTSQVHLGPRVVTVRELTFADVRDWLRRREILKSCDVIHALAFEDFGIDDLAEMSDATTEEMEACAPCQIFIPSFTTSSLLCCGIKGFIGLTE